MIKVEHLTKSFDSFFALHDLNMTVPKGAVYGLVGPNGAGKSTLIRHVTGAYRPDSGTLLVDGQPVYENPAVKARIANIPDDFYYFQSATTRDMMHFYRGMYPKFDMERYEKLKEAFASVDEKRPIRRLSKGMQKQAAFWLALVHRGKHVLQGLVPPGVEPGVEAPVEPHHVPGGGGQEVVQLVGDVGDAGLGRRVLVDRLPVQQHRAGVLPVHPGDVAQQGGFPRPVGAHQAVDGALGHRHGQPVQGAEAVKALDQVFCFDHGFSSPLSPVRAAACSSRAASSAAVMPRNRSSAAEASNCRSSSVRRWVFPPSCRAAKEPFPATVYR